MECMLINTPCSDDYFYDRISHSENSDPLAGSVVSPYKKVKLWLDINTSDFLRYLLASI